MPRRSPLKSPPPPSAAWAYFLDFDGTLVELAERPDAAAVDRHLMSIVASLMQATNGAVALISGRAIDDLVSRFGSGVAIAGQHGAERLTSDGRLIGAPVDVAALDSARAFLRCALNDYPALLLEDKGQSLALHYRANRRLAGFAHQVMHAAKARVANDFAICRGKAVVELRWAGRDKGDAIADFLAEAPFQRKRPVFIGDDRTDEAAFALINEMHGVSVKVGPGATTARWRLPDVHAVLRWLSQVGEACTPRAVRSVVHADA